MAKNQAVRQRCAAAKHAEAVQGPSVTTPERHVYTDASVQTKRLYWFCTVLYWFNTGQTSIPLLLGTLTTREAELGALLFTLTEYHTFIPGERYSNIPHHVRLNADQLEA